MQSGRKVIKALIKANNKIFDIRKNWIENTIKIHLSWNVDRLIQLVNIYRKHALHFLDISLYLQPIWVIKDNI